MSDKESLILPVELKGPVQLDKIQEHKIKLPRRRPLVIHQTDDIKDIVTFARTKRDPVYPSWRQHEIHERELRERISELSDKTFVFISRSIHASANVGENHNYSDDIGVDVFLSELNKPAVVFSVVNKTSFTPSANRHISGLVKEIVALIRRFTNERFSATFGLLLPSDLKSKSQFQEAMLKLTSETSKLCIPDSLTMSPRKHAKVVKAFISGVALTNSVLSKGAEAEPSLWFLTLDQFRVLTENIDQTEVSVTTHPSSGGKTLALEVIKRLEKNGPSLLISDDKDLLERARSSKVASEIQSPETLQESKDSLGSITNIVAHCDPALVPHFIHKLSGIRHIWKFLKYEAQDDADCKYPPNIQTYVTPADDSEGAIGDYKDSNSSMECAILEDSDSVNDNTDLLKTLSGLTNSKIVSWTTDVKRTTAVDYIVKKFEQDISWVTITGLQGEGKTTLGHMVLKDMKEKGYAVWVLNEPEEYHIISSSSSSRNTKKSVFMLDDIFGSIVLEPELLRLWYSLITTLHEANITPSKGSSENKNECFLFICNTTISQKLSVYLSRYERSIFPCKTFIIDVKEKYSFSSETVNLSTIEEEIRDRESILEHYLDETPFAVSESEKFQICKMELNHGFAHTCQLFVYLHNEHKMDILNFFADPFSHLEKITNSCLRGMYTLDPLIEMIRHDGKISLESEKISELLHIFKQADSKLPEVFLMQEENFIVFSHPSILEHVILSIGKHDPPSVLQNCKASFVCQRIKNADDDKTRYINIDTRNVDVRQKLVEHFASVLHLGMFDVLRHELFGYSDFCKGVVATLTDGTNTEETEHLRENYPKALDHFDVQGYTLLQASVRWANVNMIHALLQNGADVNIKCQDVNDHDKTAIHFLCEQANVDKETLKLLVQRKFHVDAADNEGRTALHHLSMRSESKILFQILLGEEADVSVEDAYGKSAMHYLFERIEVDKDLVNLLIEHASSVNAIDKWGKTVLHYTCERNNLNMSLVSYLIEKGSDVNITDEWSNTPLHLVAENRIHNINIIDFFIKHGSKVNCVNNEGNTPLHLICKQKYIRIDEVMLLIKHGADINMTDGDGRTVLTSVCERGLFDPHILDTFIEGGADVNKADANGNTALHFWCMKVGSDVKFLDKLLKSNAYVNIPNRFGKTPLHYVCGANASRSNIVQLLLDHGADVNAIDRNGKTLLITLCEEGSANKDTAILLIDKKSKVDNTDIYQKTALHYLCERDNIENFLVELLVQHGADINKKDGHGFTSLHYCCVREDIDDMTKVTDFFVRKGAHFSSRDEWKRTPMHCYCERKHVDAKVIEFMVEKGADVNAAGPLKRTVLHTVCSDKPLQTEIIQTLIELKADAVLTDVNERTPLHLLCDNNTITKNSIGVLIEAGASVNAIDENGKTPLHYVGENGTLQEDLVKMFLKHGVDLYKTDSKGISVLQYMLKEASLKKLAEHYTAGGLKRHAMHDEKCYEDISSDLGRLQKFAKNHDVNQLDNFGKTLLNYACVSSKINLEIIQFLLHHMSDISAKDGEQMTALHVICRRTDVEIDSCVRLFLGKGLDVTLTDRTRNTVLHYVCKRPNLGEKTLDLIKELIAKGADVEQVDDKGLTVLHYLAMYGSCDGLHTILLNVRDPNIPVTHDVGKVILRGQTALHLACMSADSNTKMIQELSRKVNILISDRKGRTPLHYICQRAKKFTYNQETNEWKAENVCQDILPKRKEMMELLMPNRTKHNRQQNFQMPEFDRSSDSGLGATSDRSPVRAKRETKVSTVIRNFVNMTDYTRCSALQYLSRNRVIHRDAFRYLLEQGADISVQDYDGITVLHSLVLAGENVLLKSMVKRRNPNLNNVVDENDESAGLYQVIPGGQTLLHLACRTVNAKREIVEMLLPHVDKDAKDCHGNTPLHYICEEPKNIVWDQDSYELVIRPDKGKDTDIQSVRFNIAKILIQNGCDRTIIDEKGAPALHGEFQRKIGEWERQHVSC